MKNQPRLSETSMKTNELSLFQFCQQMSQTDTLKLLWNLDPTNAEGLHSRLKKKQKMQPQQYNKPQQENRHQKFLKIYGGEIRQKYEDSFGSRLLPK